MGTMQAPEFERLRALRGVRAAFLVRDGSVVTDVGDGGLSPGAATDVAKTVRRMQLASATVGAPFDEVCISLAGIRLLVRAVGEHGAVVLLLRRGAELASVRTQLARVMPEIARRVGDAGTDGASVGASGTSEDASEEAERLWEGPLRGLLEAVRDCYAGFLADGEGAVDPKAAFDEQLREWLMCCNPSSYTFPLLIDGLAQTLDDRPDIRRRFKDEVQAHIGNGSVWSAFEKEVSDVGS